MSDRPLLQGPLVIVYHGTDQQAAARIAKEGFRPGTYFARHLEDATGFGGEYIFEVAFPKGPADRLSRQKRGWQFVNPWVVPPSWIVAQTLYRSEPIMRNENLRKLVFKSNR